jgi:signal transduction histidine kinase
VHLAGEGLPQALRDLAAHVNARHGIACEVHCPGTVPIADNTIATHVFRLVQEAVNNAAKHAKPHHIEIRVAVKAGRIEVRVNDDGIGFTPERRLWRGMGLHIMDYRAHAVNGTLKIQRGPAGKGTHVHCSLPADQS